MSVERPGGVTAIAILFIAVSAYLAALGIIKLADPDAISLSLGAPFLHGLELDGPYMFLIAAAVGVAIAVGLLRLSRLARRGAVIIVLAGMILQIPKVAAETSEFSPRFFLAALAVIIRVMIVWYLWQNWTAEKFVRR